MSWEMHDEENVKERNDVVEVVRKVSLATSSSEVFIVLENSSGTGKTQMAFNLQASKEFDVFYVLCTALGDRDQVVYKAFKMRMAAFLSCIREDMKTVEEGSVGVFETIDTLQVYAFIAAAIRGAEEFGSPATRASVERALYERKLKTGKPFVVFLDEFPRGMSSSDKHESKARLMRNVFRSFRMPMIVSFTNGTARNLSSFGERSRDMSGSQDVTPWCVVVPSLPPVCVNGECILFTSESDSKLARIPSVLKWFLQHSRPLFAKEAWKYISMHDNYGDTSESWLQYLKEMTGYLAPKLRRFKVRKGSKGKRGAEFKLGQVSILLASSYTVSNKGVNLVDSHFGYLSESESFELDLDADGLLKGDESWKGHCQFSKPESDILLHLTMIGDHNNSVDAGSADEKGDSILRRFSGRLHVMLQDPFFRGKDFSGKHKTNDGMTFRALVTGAVVLASHRDKFGGVTFPAFLGRLSYELGVGEEIDSEVHLPLNHAKNASIIPFLSVPNTEWPQPFLDVWEASSSQFANFCRPPNSEQIDFTFTLGNGSVLSGECKDHDHALTPDIVEGVLNRVPDESSTHLVVTRKLQNTYYTRYPDPVSAACAALERAKLQYANFYRISEDGMLEEFMEFMAAKATFSEDIFDDNKTDRGDGKLVISIEIGNWDEPKDKIKRHDRDARIQAGAKKQRGV